MSLLESFYLKSPLWLQNLLIQAEGFRINLRRYGSEFRSVFQEFLKHQEYSEDKLLVYQREKVQIFLKEAKTAPYWNKVFLEYRIDLESDDIFSEIKKLPFLNKEMVKQNIMDFLPSSMKEGKLYSCHTSGTTGSGMVFWETRSAEWERWATWWRYRQSHGIDRNTLCAYFGGRSIVPLNQTKPPFWRFNSPGNQLMFSAYHLNKSSAAEYLRTIEQYSVPWLHGYPSALTLLAKLINEIKLEVPSCIKVATTGAENLMPFQRKIISETFKIPVYQHYGQAESVANISECPKGQLHVDEDFSFVEFIPLTDSENQYRIIGTNWTNPSFPLIRYETGDIATIKKTICDCGNRGRIISEIDGRKEDYVTLADGSKVGRLDHIFKDLINIREAQIYQPAIGEFIFRVVKGTYYDERGEEKKLLSEAKKRLGEHTRYTFEYLNEIPKSKSGKLRLVVSDVQEKDQL